jgi:hypothetical protein
LISQHGCLWPTTYEMNGVGHAVQPLPPGLPAPQSGPEFRWHHSSPSTRGDSKTVRQRGQRARLGWGRATRTSQPDPALGAPARALSLSGRTRPRLPVSCCFSPARGLADLAAPVAPTRPIPRRDSSRSSWARVPPRSRSRARARPDPGFRAPARRRGRSRAGARRAARGGRVSCSCSPPAGSRSRARARPDPGFRAPARRRGRSRAGARRAARGGRVSCSCSPAAVSRSRARTLPLGSARLRRPRAHGAFWIERSARIMPPRATCRMSFNIAIAGLRFHDRSYLLMLIDGSLVLRGCAL